MENIDGRKLIKDSMEDMARFQLHNFINNLFVELHAQHNTTGGDVTPAQVERIDSSVEIIAKTMASQVIQNMKI